MENTGFKNFLRNKKEKMDKSLNLTFLLLLALTGFVICKRRGGTYRAFSDLNFNMNFSYCLHLGARSADAQIFGRQFKAFTVVELNRERFVVLVQAQFSRPGGAHQWPASVLAAEAPAILPKTAPDISPVPPG